MSTLVGMIDRLLIISLLALYDVCTFETVSIRKTVASFLIYLKKKKGPMNAAAPQPISGAAVHRKSVGVFSVAPASKSVALVACVCSVVVGLCSIENQATMGARHSLHPAYFRLRDESRDTKSAEGYVAVLVAWALSCGKLLLGSFTSIAPGELLVSIFALLSTAKLEHAVGSLRLVQMFVFLFAGRLLGLVAWAVLVQDGSLLFLKPSIAWLPLGLHTCRRSITPAAPLFEVFGIVVTTQTLPDLVALQLVLMNLDALDLVLPSVVCGLIMSSNVVALHRWSPWPRLRQRICPETSPATVWHRNPRSAGATVVSRNSSTQTQAGRPTQPAGGRPPGGGGARGEEALTEEHLRELISMGFPRETAIVALRQTRNDVNAAAQLLLDGQ